MSDLRHATAAAVRPPAGHGEFAGPTPGLALGLRPGQPRRRAARPGVRLPALLPAQPEAVPAAGRDRARRARSRSSSRPGPTCAPTCRRYRVYRNGELVDEPTDLPPLVARRPRRRSCIGCSFTFENALLQAGVPVRHIEQGCNVPMYRTNIAVPAGGRVSRADGRVDAADDAGAGRDGDAHLRAASRAPTARRSTSATRRRSASATSPGPTSATRSRSGPARCRCSGRAASRRRRW